MPSDDPYGVPPTTTRLPPLRMWIVMCAIPLGALLLWLVLPDSPLTVALLVLAVIAAVFTGVGWVLRARGLNRPPGRSPGPTR